MRTNCETHPSRAQRWCRRAVVLGIIGATIAAVASPGSAMPPAAGEWAPVARVEDQAGTHPEFNGGALDGCPFIAPDDRTFFMASNRSGGLGGIDIWISTRPSPDAPWGEPVNAGAPINSADNDFCPTMSRDGHTLFFISNRPGHCGGDDLFMARRRPGGWSEAENLGCAVDGGPNSAANEAGPFPLQEPGGAPSLYFSSTRSGNSDIYRATFHGGGFGPASPVDELNSTMTDGQPNLSRDGLEIYFFSNRPGSAGNDIYVATRASAQASWSPPENLGPNVNSAASETRPSLSWDGTTLYLGSNRAGGDGDVDHYRTTRERRG